MSYRKLLEEQGWFVVRGVLPQKDIDTALGRLREIAADIENWPQLPKLAPASVPELRDSPDPLFRFDWIDGATLHDAILWETVAAHPNLLEIARDVIGEDVFPLNGGGFFLKPPGSPKNVPWHQDASPFSMVPVEGQTSNPLLFDFWLGFTEATAEMGALQVVPGSQHRGRLPHEEGGGLLPQIDLAQVGYTEKDIVTVETGPGDLIVWHQDMIHGSETNRSNKPRIAVASVYHGRPEEDSLREHHRKGANRRRPQLCHGPQIFPFPEDVPTPAQGLK